MLEAASQRKVEAESASMTARGDLGAPDWEKLDRMLDKLPPGIPILPPEDATNFSKYRYNAAIVPKEEAWKKCVEAMEKADRDVCKNLREQMDTLLVFAGLFSAVVAAFTIESYKWLQNDPNDTTNILLAQIANSVGGRAAQDIHATPAPPSSSGVARSVSARINAYWFVSLILGLSCALVVILGKQWLRGFEYQPTNMTPREVIGVRQLRSEGFWYWGVGNIIHTLPMLLQLSLALFSLGILELLWHLHTTVAIVVCLPTVFTLLFYLLTTILPALQYSQRFGDAPPPRQCPFKSPQAFEIIRLYQLAVRGWAALTVRFYVSNARIKKEVWNSQ